MIRTIKIPVFYVPKLGWATLHVDLDRAYRIKCYFTDHDWREYESYGEKRRQCKFCYLEETKSGSVKGEWSMR